MVFTIMPYHATPCDGVRPLSWKLFARWQGDKAATANAGGALGPALAPLVGFASSTSGNVEIATKCTYFEDAFLGVP